MLVFLDMQRVYLLKSKRSFALEEEPMPTISLLNLILGLMVLVLMLLLIFLRNSDNRRWRKYIKTVIAKRLPKECSHCHKPVMLYKNVTARLEIVSPGIIFFQHTECGLYVLRVPADEYQKPFEAQLTSSSATSLTQA